ncbi:hypothetical protein [Flavobacterium sp. J27]|uniref:hypothetical protein n=1 Tax=Flavobacterium sp. J27 TaxID=2060419 RepID=UPI00102F9E28|nr:hypothetical protein [Flavobacterium sp. J27]
MGIGYKTNFATKKIPNNATLLAENEYDLENIVLDKDYILADHTITENISFGFVIEEASNGKSAYIKIKGNGIHAVVFNVVNVNALVGITNGEILEENKYYAFNFLFNGTKVDVFVSQINEYLVQPNLPANVVNLFDFTNATSLVLESSSLVTQINEFFANGNNLNQATTTNKPTIVGSFADFDGTNDVLKSNIDNLANFNLTGTQYTIAMKIQLKEIKNCVILDLSHTEPSNSLSIHGLWIKNSKLGFGAYYRSTTNITKEVATSSLTLNEDIILIMENDNLNLSFSVNGIAAATTGQNPFFGSGTNPNLQLGCGALTNTLFSNFKCSKIVHYDRLLSEAEKTELTEFLNN